MTWHDYSPIELEREYTPASCVDDVQIYLNHYASAGTHSRLTFRHEKLKYGQHVEEWLWLAPLTNTENHEKKLVVFVHGGFWRRLSADDGTFLTPGFHQLGYDYASINYSLCPNEPLETLIDQTQKAIRFLQTTHDPSNITLVGHSAGAHLIAMALSRSNSTRCRICTQPFTNSSGSESPRHANDSYLGRERNQRVQAPVSRFRLSVGRSEKPQPRRHK